MTYLDSIANDIRGVVSPDALPEGDASNLFRSYAVLLLAKGESVTGEDVHNAWVAWMKEKGEQHESMVPFNELPIATQKEDSPFVLAIRQVARERKVGGSNQSS
jgi:hypothetical protein